MRVAVISTTVFRHCSPHGVSGYGGLEPVAWLIAKGLAARGHKVCLIAPDGSECPGVEIIPTGPERQHDEKMAYSGYPDMGNEHQVIRKSHAGYWQKLLDVDCVIDHSWQKNSYLLKEEGRMKNIPILGVLHAPCDTMMKSPPPVEKPCIVCISEDQKQHYESLFSPSEARVARNGIDINLYKSLEIPRTDRFLFLARFSKIKGPLIALEAAKQTGVGLDMIGDTSITNEPELLKECKAKADGEQIRLVGPVSRGETVYWYSRSHVMLHPTRFFREPLGLAPLEAQSCGTPVISWRWGAMKETIQHGETGWLVSSEGELNAVIETVKAGRGVVNPAMRKRCREWVADNFSEVQMVAQYEKLCLEAIDKPW